LRTRSDAAIEAVRASHREEISHTNETHQEALESATRPLEKKINSLTVEANAARDDLAKAKGTISTQAAELKALQEQVTSLKAALEKALATPPTVGSSEQLEALRNELRNAKDDFETLKEVHQSSQENFAATMNNHRLELEEAAKGRVQALAALESKHEADKARFAEGNNPYLTLSRHISYFVLLERAILQRKLEDEREAKDRALAALNNQQTRTPPVTPRVSHISSGSRDSLERLHHANDARLNQLETEHKQAIAQLTYVMMKTFKVLH
jgi:chromosome segregation ATPase